MLCLAVKLVFETQIYFIPQGRFRMHTERATTLHKSINTIHIIDYEELPKWPSAKGNTSSKPRVAFTMHLAVGIEKTQ